jgi:Zn-dependent protease
MFKLANLIPIRVHSVFWVLALIIGFLNSDGDIPKTMVWVAIIFVSVLFHEFGHALTALAFGQRSIIELVALGGVTRRRGGAKLSLWKEFLIVLDGPLFGLVLAFAAFYILQFIDKNTHPMWFYAFKVTANVNVFWTILNLLPVQPLDGGHLLRIIFEGIFGFRGVKIALFLSTLFAVGLAVLSFVGGEFFIGAIFLIFTFESYRMWQASLSVTAQDNDMSTQLLLKEAEKEIRDGNTQAGIEKLRQVRQKSEKGLIYLTASQHLAEHLADEGEYQEAFDILSPIKGKLPPEKLRLLQQLAFKIGDWASTISVGGKAYQANPTYDVALTNALAHAQLGEDRPAVGWLQRAIRDGMPNLRAILSKTEFDAIRNSPLFKQLEQGG